MRHVIRDVRELKLGKVYNREYVGPDEDYKKINGKTTFLVIFNGSHLVIRTFFSVGGDYDSPFLESHYSQFNVPHQILHEYRIYECANKTKWFIHCQVMTLEVAITKKFISVDTLSHIFADRSQHFNSRNPVVFYASGSCYINIAVSPTTKYPFLQGIALGFNNYEDLKTQVRSYCPQAWFFH